MTQCHREPHRDGNTHHPLFLPKFFLLPLLLSISIIGNGISNVYGEEICATRDGVTSCDTNKNEVIVNIDGDSMVSKVTCKDANDLCEKWAADGECAKNPKYMRPNCRMSCDICEENKYQEMLKSRVDQFVQSSKIDEMAENHLTDYQVRKMLKFGVEQTIHGNESAETKEVALKSIKYMETLFDTDKDSWGNCKNEHVLCAFWAGLGECDNNPDTMMDICGPSCQKCGDSVSAEQSTDTNTGSIEIKDVTNSNDSFSDVTTKGCSDRHDKCEEWTKNGECTKNPEYMLHNCKLSCGTCDDHL